MADACGSKMYEASSRPPRMKPVKPASSAIETSALTGADARPRKPMPSPSLVLSIELTPMPIRGLTPCALTGLLKVSKRKRAAAKRKTFRISNKGAGCAREISFEGGGSSVKVTHPPRQSLDGGRRTERRRKGGFAPAQRRFQRLLVEFERITVRGHGRFSGRVC